MKIELIAPINNTSPSHSLSIRRGYSCKLDRSHAEDTFSDGYFQVRGKANGDPDCDLDRSFLAFISQAKASISVRRCPEEYSWAFCELYFSEDGKFKTFDVNLDFTSKAFDDLVGLVIAGAKALQMTFFLDAGQLSYALNSIRDAKQWSEHQWSTGIEEFDLGILYSSPEEPHKG